MSGVALRLPFQSDPVAVLVLAVAAEKTMMKNRSSAVARKEVGATNQLMVVIAEVAVVYASTCDGHAPNAISRSRMATVTATGRCTRGVRIIDGNGITI